METASLAPQKQKKIRFPTTPKLPERLLFANKPAIDHPVQCDQYTVINIQTKQHSAAAWGHENRAEHKQSRHHQ